ncbi:hypothetical protein QTP86_013041 [Hemibagrus guttatus]|nr:hypothetical protein QTP86_013041 [Hemibagrus guttatus]
MFKHKGAHQYTWYQDTLGWRSMINLVVVSSDLRPHVLDTRVKRGAELSYDHHLVSNLGYRRSNGVFDLVVEHWTSSIPSTGCLRVCGSLPNQSTCVFVDLEKAFNRVPYGIMWEVLWEYGVRGPLLRAVRSLYNGAGAWFALPAAQPGAGGSPVFADDIVLLAPSSLDLQHALGRFAAECEAAGLRVSTSKSEAMVLNRKKVACTLQVGGEVLPQVEEFKYLGVLFTSEGRMDREIDRRIGAAAAVMRSMYWSVVVKMELSQKAKLSIYQSIYVPILTYGHELWVMTERVNPGYKRPK